MAAYMGKSGSARIAAATIAFIDSWTLNPSIDIVDITAFGSSFRARAQTLRDWSVDISGTLDRSDTEQADLLDQFEDGTLANIAIRLYTKPASYWAGNALMANGSIVSSVGDKITLALSLVCNGQLSYSAS